MRSIVCIHPGQLEFADKPAPVPDRGQALLAIRRVGVCGTDLHAFAGNQAYFTYPRILGHELAAEVLDIGPNPEGILRGDPVIPIPYLHCGTCIACRGGRTNCCSRIQVLGVHADGGMQELLTVPTELLLPGKDLSWDQMALTEPLAIGAHAVRRAGLRAGEKVVVVGCGPIGLGLIYFAKRRGAEVAAIDTDPFRLEFAAETFGADLAVPAGEEAPDTVREWSSGDMATAVFDATGYAAALESGIRYMAHGGRYVLVGLSKGPLTFMHPEIHAKETSLLCSRNATREDFEEVITALPAYPADAYITHRLAFGEVPRRFAELTERDNQVVKAVISL